MRCPRCGVKTERIEFLRGQGLRAWTRIRFQRRQELDLLHLDEAHLVVGRALKLASTLRRGLHSERVVAGGQALHLAIGRGR